ncbi:unnamed protein product [Urochloa humidicola]
MPCNLLYRKSDGPRCSFAERRRGKTIKCPVTPSPSSLLLQLEATSLERAPPGSPRRRFRRLRHLPFCPAARLPGLGSCGAHIHPDLLASSMGLDRYGASRVFFSWQKRRVNKTKPKTSQKVLAGCKNQIGLGGKCTYMGLCTALEAHKRLQTDKPCQLSWSELESKALALKDVDETKIGRLERCLTVLERTGIHYVDSKGKETEDILKIKDFTRISTKNEDSISEAVKNHMKKGPMPRVEVIKIWSHLVCVTGFGVQGFYPFWEFQNTYGPKWRGAARGFGQIYAVHLHRLYAFTLA